MNNIVAVIRPPSPADVKLLKAYKNEDGPIFDHVKSHIPEGTTLYRIQRFISNITK